MTADPRAGIYQDLHKGQLSQQELQNRHSAETILGIVREYLKPQSILDVGCGLGTWLDVARGMGMTDFLGVEGSWLDRSKTLVDGQKITIWDLEQPLVLNRKFDLVVSLEVGEHLSAAAAPVFVESLVRHGDLILFSAAIPFQGGHHHVNEQFPDYWCELFSRHGFQPLDPIRGRIWNDPKVLWWLRQNTILFAHERLLAGNEKLAREKLPPRPLSIVHPDVYLSRLQEAHRLLAEHRQLMEFLNQGGTFAVARLPDGRININKVSS